MDLLKFGMENRKSPSAVRRRLAEAALSVEKTRADLEEKAIEKSGIRIPETDDREMLREIKARIEAEEKSRGQSDRGKTD